MFVLNWIRLILLILNPVLFHEQGYDRSPCWLYRDYEGSVYQRFGWPAEDPNNPPPCPY